MSETALPPRRPPIFGPEPWQEISGLIWSHWDLWFCVVAVADHDADLHQLEKRIIREMRDHTRHRDDAESKLSHLADLRVRLENAGLVPGNLVNTEVLAERGLLAKAHKKLAAQYMDSRAMSPAMIETPRVRLVRRSRTGHWGTFPVNPDRYYRSFRRTVEAKNHITGGASFSAVRRIAERLESLDKEELPPAERLALYRAFHTAALELADRADDSFGNIGEMRREAWYSYLAIDWQAAGMAAQHYWEDLCDLVVFEDYALGFHEETLPWSRIPAGQDELVESVLQALENECRTYQLDYPADQALEQSAWLAVANARLTRYLDLASRLGTDHWREVEAMAESALHVANRPDLAVEVFRTADRRPGMYQELLRERCASLTGVVLGGKQQTPRPPRGHVSP
ncbi:MAG: hypothetical protein M0Z34_07115 [Nitrospiraceae bacterium]|nr:hypothetical protein [Nitrospiraceae bacterium]